MKCIIHEERWGLQAKGNSTDAELLLTLERRDAPRPRRLAAAISPFNPTSGVHPRNSYDDAIGGRVIRITIRCNGPGMLRDFITKLYDVGG